MNSLRIRNFQIARMLKFGICRLNYKITLKYAFNINNYFRKRKIHSKPLLEVINCSLCLEICFKTYVLLPI